MPTLWPSNPVPRSLYPEEREIHATSSTRWSPTPPTPLFNSGYDWEADTTFLKTNLNDKEFPTWLFHTTTYAFTFWNSNHTSRDLQLETEDIYTRLHVITKYWTQTKYPSIQTGWILCETSILRHTMQPFFENEEDLYEFSWNNFQEDTVKWKKQVVEEYVQNAAFYIRMKGNKKNMCLCLCHMYILKGNTGRRRQNLMKMIIFLERGWNEVRER